MANKKPTHARTSLNTVEPGPQGSGEKSHARTLLSRREFLYGAAGVGAALVVAGGVGTAIKLTDQNNESIPETLSVASSAVISSDELGEIAADECVSLVGNFRLPFGTLVWANSDSIAACLVPTEDTTTPLAQIALLFLGSGNYPIVVNEALSGKGFDIYDVRASEQGIIWTEANIMKNSWRIYTAPITEGEVGKAALADEGDGEWETPSIAVVGNKAFWQILPSLEGSKLTEDSLLKSVKAGGTESEIVYVSHGRMSSPLYALTDGVVTTPRSETTTVHHQLTLIDAKSGEVRDMLTLPQGMKPLEAGYGTTGFSFSFEGIYDYGDGIANLGTYTPTTTSEPENYAERRWFRFARTPTAPPAWTGKYFIVKSPDTVCGIDMDADTYFALDIEAGSEKYGDYLASTGVHETFVTYTNIDDKSSDGSENHYTLARVWRPLS